MTMNPMSLLTKGRTIGGLKGRPGRYKLLCNSALPNFSAAKGAIPTTTHAEPEKAQAAFFEQPKTVAADRTDGTKKEKPEVMAAVSAVQAQEQPAKAGLWSYLAVIPTGWLHKWIPRRKTPPFPSAAVQTELVLEKVKVMRNDLSEDDLEVVLSTKKAGKKAENPAQGEKVERELLTAHP
jgi:hypothetical protein